MEIKWKKFLIFHELLIFQEYVCISKKSWLQKFLVHFIFQLLIFQERLSMTKKNNWLQKFHHVAQSKERKKERKNFLPRGN